MATRPCPICGNENRVAARFCDGCGAVLQPEAAAAHARPDHGELKYVTVLFADIVGSTELVADLSPDDARGALAPAIMAMIQAVEAFGGTINQRLGDGVMALFGVPFIHEDHALRACCAALRMHEMAAAHPSSNPLRVGIASGLTLLSSAATKSTDTAGAYPAFGATVHLASRLQGLARPATTLCAASTRALAGAAVRLVPLGPHALRGFRAEQDVFALNGLDQADLRFSRSVARGLSPLVGRDAELAALYAHTRPVQDGAPTTVAIVGEAGAGKSRLAWEFAGRMRDESWRVVQAEALSYGRDVPYQLVGALLRSGFAIGPGDEPAQTIRHVQDTAATAVLGGAGPISAPALLSLLGLPVGEHAATWDPLDPRRRREVLDETMRSLLAALCHGPATLLLIEDLHWADEESLRLLYSLWTIPGGWMLLATHRTQFAPPWARPFTDVIALRPLSSDSMARLLDQAFPAIASPATRGALIERSAGNPFFLEELARDTLIAALPPDAAEHPSVPSTVPSTIQAVVAARIDRLSPEAKDLLVTASVLGNRFPLKTLRGLFAGDADRAFDMQLDTLCGTGLFRPMQERDAEVVFSHALIQEVAYTGLPRGQRCDLHGQVVHTIKRIDADRQTELAETLAYHADRGELWDELIVAAGAAGRRASDRSAFVEAARFFNQAIEACARVGRTPDVLATEIELRFQLRSALFPTAGIERSLANSVQAERCARELGDTRRLGWATAYVAKDLQLVGRPADALEAAARAMKLAHGESALVIASRYFAGQAYYSRGDYALAVTTLRALIVRLEANDPTAWAGTPGPSVIFYRAWIIWSQARMGDEAGAAATAAEMRRLADEVDLPLCRMIAHLSEGFALAFAGRLHEAEATLRFALALCRKWELFAWSTNITSCLGHVLSRLGEPAEAFDLIERAVDRTRRSGILVSHANELAWLAEAHHRAGRPDQAEFHARQALTFALSHGERGNEALARLVLGEALTGLGARPDGVVQLMAALDLATECGMAPLVERAQCRLAHPHVAAGDCMHKRRA